LVDEEEKCISLEKKLAYATDTTSNDALQELAAARVRDEIEKHNKMTQRQIGELQNKHNAAIAQLQAEKSQLEVTYHFFCIPSVLY
jgi:hypothetical protein